MSNDSRCCGTGTCLINADGVCWCGQRWDGEKMCPPALDHAPVSSPAPAVPAAQNGH
ncbi:MAG: hypothetical protein MUP33_02875 [Polaromonas sp.]|nr:hypothetical protein [Polaromonas sp.]